MWDFIADRWEDIAYRSYQHTSLVVQSVLLATIIALVLAVIVIRNKKLESFANIFSAIGLMMFASPKTPASSLLLFRNDR